MSDRADMIMQLVRDEEFSRAESEIGAMEADLMQHANENARLNRALSDGIRISAVHLHGGGALPLTVAIEVDGKWVPVIVESGTNISHICETGGLRTAIEKARK